MENNLETCLLGHKFLTLPDHPMKDGRARCPHCMAIAIEKKSDEQSILLDQILDRDISTLGLPDRVLDCLKETFVPQEWKDRNPDYYKNNLCLTVRDLIAKTDYDLVHRFRLGKKSLLKLEKCLEKSGLTLGMLVTSYRKSGKGNTQR
ncbi:MAG: hypothetical protein WCG19_04950 [Chlorobiaceae bacterium]